jgi:hypothetical protein
MSEGAAGSLKKRQDEGYCCTLIGRYLMESLIKV